MMTPSSVSRTMKAIGALVPVLYLCGILAACVLPNILANKTMPEAALSERLSDILREVRSQMVRVEGGSFAMGCTPEQEKCNPDESPVRRVQVASFEIGRYEVTQELWQAIMGENPSAFGDCPQCPVETVSWDDIQTFLRKLNEGGGTYRLPSEAEWEYASRGGQRSRGHQHAGSDNWAEVAWYYENADNRTHCKGSSYSLQAEVSRPFLMKLYRNR